MHTALPGSIHFLREGQASRRLEKLMAHRASRILNEQRLPSSSSGKHARVLLLIETGCSSSTRKNQLSLPEHDTAKYNAYLERLRADLSGSVISPHTSEHSIEVLVQATAPADSSVDSVGSYAVGSRLGAFEVYLCGGDSWDVETAPQCTCMHSKLETRRWPNPKLIERRCHAVLDLVFNRWKADEDLSGLLPHLLAPTVVDATELRAARDEFWGRAAPSLLEQVQQRLEVIEEADATLIEAMNPGYSPEAIKVLCIAVEEQRESASPSLHAQAEVTLLQWLTSDADNRALRDAPNDRAALQAVLAEHSAHASADVLAEARGRMEAIVQADARLLIKMEAADVKALYTAIEQFGDRASPGVTSDAWATVHRLVAEADAALKEEMGKVDDAATAHHLCEKYRNSASDDVMAQMLCLSERFDAADAALRVAIQAGEVDGLKRALREHLLAASRKLVDISVSLLAKLEADFGLRSAPADQQTLRTAIEMHAAAASKEMLDNAKERLLAIQVADAALEQAGMPQACPAQSISLLRQAIPEHGEQASPALLQHAVAKLAQLEAAADAALRKAAAPVKEATELAIILEAHRKGPTQPALKEVAERLRSLEASDSSLYEAMERDPDVVSRRFYEDTLRDLQEIIVRHQPSASPSVLLLAEEVLRQWFEKFTSNCALQDAPRADRAALDAAIGTHGSTASAEVVSEALERLRKLDIADRAIIEALKGPKEGDVKRIRKAIADHRDEASESVVVEAASVQAQLEAEADRELQIEMSPEAIFEVHEAHAVLCRYAGRASLTLMEHLTEKWKQADAVNAKLQAAVYDCSIDRISPKELLNVMEHSRPYATPSFMKAAEATYAPKLELLTLEADNALCTASKDDLRHVFETVEAYASELSLAVARAAIRVLDASSRGLQAIASLTQPPQHVRMANAVRKTASVLARKSRRMAHVMRSMGTLMGTRPMPKKTAVKDSPVEWVPEWVTTGHEKAAEKIAAEKAAEKRGIAAAIAGAAGAAVGTVAASAASAASAAVPAATAAFDATALGARLEPKVAIVAKIVALEVATAKLNVALHLLTEAVSRHRTRPRQPHESPHGSRQHTSEYASRTYVAVEAVTEEGTATLKACERKLLRLTSSSYNWLLVPLGLAKPHRAYGCGVGFAIWDSTRVSRLPLHKEYWLEAVFKDWAALAFSAKPRPGFGAQHILPAASTWQSVRMLRRQLRALEQPQDPVKRQHYVWNWELSAIEREHQQHVKLPAGWQAVWYEEYNRFWYASEDGRQTWEVPTDSGLAPAIPQLEPLPAGWHEMYDPASGQPFYVNETAPDQATWVRPTKQQVWLFSLMKAWHGAAKRKKQGRKQAEKLQAAKVALPMGWTENYDKKSKRWYFTSEDGAVSWERPTIDVTIDEELQAQQAEEESKKTAKEAQKEAQEKACALKEAREKAVKEALAAFEVQEKARLEAAAQAAAQAAAASAVAAAEAAAANAKAEAEAEAAKEAKKRAIWKFKPELNAMENVSTDFESNPV